MDFLAPFLSHQIKRCLQSLRLNAASERGHAHLPNPETPQLASFIYPKSLPD